MTSLLTLRPSPPPAPAWYADADTPYDEASLAQFKGMPGVRWNAAAKVWRGPREAIALVAATLEAAKVCKVRNESWGLTTGNVELLPSDADARLRTYQAEGVSWLRWMLHLTGAALLADEMGLGKTPQAIVALCAEDEPTLVVCPAVVVPHWEEEIYRWASLPPTIARAQSLGNGEPTSEADAPIQKLWRVMSYEKFVACVRKRAFPDEPQALGPYTRVVFDEIHYLSSRPAKSDRPAQGTSKRSGAVSDWLRAHAVRPRVIGLTGTPMLTRPRDLWHPLEVLWPGRFGTWWDFTKRYCDGHTEEITNDAGVRITNSEGEPLRPVWVCDGISRAEELRTRLAHCMLRRTKQQVGAELPPRTRTIVEVPLPSAARRDLRRASAAIDFGAAGPRSAVGALLAHAESYKIDAAEALARDVMAAGSRPLLLTTRRDSARTLGERLVCPSVTGDDKAADRRAIIADAPCAAATLYSVEVGINLTGFDVVIFVGLDWVPARILQGEARIHRIGQDRPCTIYYLIARGTVDEIIRARVIERLEQFAAITGAKGDELGLRGDLAPESEDELLADIVSVAKGEAT